MKIFLFLIILSFTSVVFAKNDVNEDIAPKSPETTADTVKVEKVVYVKIKEDVKEDIKEDIKGDIEKIKKIKKGLCTSNDIKEVVNKNVKQIRYCYEKELMRTPDLAGQIKASWTISQTGKVVGVKITKNTMKTDKVSRCIVRMIKRWEFTPPNGRGVCHVAYPFNFTHK